VNSTQRKVLWTASLSHATIHVYELAVPALLILIQAEFVSGVFGLGALPAGLLVDRLGSKVLLAGCLWGSALCTAGMALSPSLGWFTVCAGSMGLFLSIYHPAGTALISTALAPSGRVFAIHGMVGNLGVAGASVIAGVLGAAFGWRWALGILASVGIGLGAFALRLAVPSLHEVRARAGRGHWPDFALLLVAAGFLGMIYRGMTTFLPKFFATSYTSGGSAGTAVGGLLTTLALFAGLGGMYTAGRMVDRGMRPVFVFMVGTLMQGPFLVALGWLAGPVLMPVVMAVAFFHFFTQPPGNQMVARFTPPRLRGLGYGVYFLVAFGTGSFGASYGGWVSERWGLGWSFPALALLLVPAIIAVALLGLRAEPASEPIVGPTAG
jgi:MFS family permease